MTALPARDLLPVPAAGRRFTARRTVRLGDVDPDGVVRLDAIGRYLQDVASDDALDAGLDNALGWVVRRTLIRIDEPASTDDALELTTYCTGSGRSWAERRTVLRSARGASIDAVSLWVQLDVASGRPARLTEGFTAVYGEAAAGRTVSSKLSLPPRPADVVAATRWEFRRADLDGLGHVNNAAQLVLLEEVGLGDRIGTAEIEYHAPADAGVAYEVVRDGETGWLVRDRTPVTTFAWRPRRRPG